MTTTRRLTARWSISTPRPCCAASARTPKCGSAPETATSRPIHKRSPFYEPSTFSSAIEHRWHCVQTRTTETLALHRGRGKIAPIMSALSEPDELEPADSLLDDREWLAGNHLEPIGRLDVSGGGMGFIALAWHTEMKRRARAEGGQQRI